MNQKLLILQLYSNLNFYDNYVFLCSNLINESLLTAAVRCVLADVLLQAYHVSCDLSHDIVLRRNKTEGMLYYLLITCNCIYID